MSNKPAIQIWPITRLIPYEKNAKIHTADQVAKIAESIRQFGWTTAISVDRNGVIIGGHGRRLAAISLGLTQVPVIVRDDLNDEQVKAARLADNRVAIADIDTDLLQAELAELNLDLTGIFDEKELSFLSANITELDVGGFVADIQAEVKAQDTNSLGHVAAVDEKDVPIAKALGFKAVKVKDQRILARFMAQIEAESGKEPAEAFVDFIAGILAA